MPSHRTKPDRLPPIDDGPLTWHDIQPMLHRYSLRLREYESDEFIDMHAEQVREIIVQWIEEQLYELRYDYAVPLNVIYQRLIWEWTDILGDKRKAVSTAIGILVNAFNVDPDDNGLELVRPRRTVAVA